MLTSPVNIIVKGSHELDILVTLAAQADDIWNGISTQKISTFPLSLLIQGERYLLGKKVEDSLDL